MNRYRIIALVLIIVSLVSFSACKQSYKENPNEELSSSAVNTSAAESTAASEGSEESESEFMSREFFEETISLPFIPFD